MIVSEFIDLVNMRLNRSLVVEDKVIVKFCADETSCNYCAELVYQRIKTATCSLAFCYDELHETEPQPEDLWLIQDWYNNPVALVKVINSKRCKFSAVTADFAAKEGEGDKSIEYWQNEHSRFFGNELTNLGLNFAESLELSLQEFEVLVLNPEWK